MKKQSVIRSAVAMALGTFSSRLLGFMRDAAMFGLFPRGVTDAFVVAFRLPNLFRRLLGEGSLSVSFIPVYVDARAAGEDRARALADAVFTVLIGAASFICVVCFVWMEPIIRFLVDNPEGFASVPGKVEQTIYLARIMIFYLLLVSSYAFYMAIANTLGHFFLPALGPALFNVGLIVFTILPWDLGPYPGSQMAWGVFAGGVLQVSVCLWLLVRLGVLPKLTVSWGGQEVRRVFLNMVPGLFGLGVYQVMMIVNTKFAARLSEGAQSYIYAADRILELPQSLVAVSLGAALLPRFSDLNTSGTREEFLREANQAVRILLYLSLPAAVGMWLLALPITQVLFQRGEFDLNDASATASIVVIYSVLMLFSSLSRVTAPAFYALKNTWLPAVVAFFVLVVHVFVGSWAVDAYGLTGLATATSASSVLNIVILQVFFFVMIGPLGYGSIFVSVARLVPGLMVLGAVCYYGYPLTFDSLAPWSGDVMARTVALGFVIGAGMAVYFGVTHLCGSETAGKVMGLLRRRIKR